WHPRPKPPYLPGMYSWRSLPCEFIGSCSGGWIGRQQRLAVAADVKHDRAALEQRDSVVSVARHLTKGLFLIIVGGAFRHRVELAHGIGDAGFFERLARAEVADLPLGEGRHPVECTDADRGGEID